MSPRGDAKATGTSLTQVMEGHTESLALLYQGAFTAAVRIQSHRQQIGLATAFRRRMRDVLAEVGRQANRRNHSSSHVAQADFAFVAFLDEVILSSDDPCRDDWAKRPLQEELFGISTAGEQFFTRLEELLALPDSPELADVLEVYVLCLLLGFKGRYIGAGHAELDLYAARGRQRIERLRQFLPQLSSISALPSESMPLAANNGSHSRLRMATVLSLILPPLCFLGFGADLLVLSASVNALLLKGPTP